ncbi:hypothetical protein LOK49_LG08G01481 [Camellia lanceoleosa]|uniref:Uncharacterized protein n=1 Tax=Camellia lanceoleosa TaxID=1840588 RepID=A0ACC0GUG8_9ERIC|nr:hypothetical protein LOK49_LG08G01481 [Camellia lanceoleosa]
MALPRFIALKSEFQKKYLSYIHEDVKAHGFLQFSGEEVVSQYTKYQVEMAKCGNGLAHIRCCYNNKYWVRSSENEMWIAAQANEPEEKQSKWSCTLFEPTVYEDGDSKTVRFRHVQLNQHACLWNAQPPHDSCLFVGSATQDNDLRNVYTIIDWESLLILPKHIAFKGDNGYYLSATSLETFPYLEFASDDIGDPTVGNEVFTNGDGSIRIKSDYFGKFWRRGSNSRYSDEPQSWKTTGANWIWADSDDTTSDNPDTVFWPIKVANNVVALRNLGNNVFCKRLTADNKTDCLNAAVCTIAKSARLEVEELVISRSIYNVEFRLNDARIYDQSIVTMATGGEVINRTETHDTVDVKLAYTETKSSTWNASVSLKLGVKTTIETGIPFVANGKVQISAELTGAYMWGETESSTNLVETVYKVSVPPMTRVKESLIATRGSCDVPFSYTQRDTLSNGKQISYRKDDGLYTGINCYNFQYEATQEKL